MDDYGADPPGADAAPALTVAQRRYLLSAGNSLSGSPLLIPSNRLLNRVVTGIAAKG